MMRGIRAGLITTALAVGTVNGLAAQRPAAAPAGAPPANAPAQAPTPAPWPAAPIKLTIGAGSSALYRVREQLAGISFPNDAVGRTEGVSGTISFNADGSLAPESRLVVDLRTLASDQEMRDGYIKGTQILDTEKYPQAVFVPRRAAGLSWPFPQGRGGQAGFQLIGDMTVHGVTKEVTWNVVATFGNLRVQGRAETQFTFDTFAIPKPKLARLLSVDDTIKLEVELRMDPAIATASGE